jgi:hypothetical protein
MKIKNQIIISLTLCALMIFIGSSVSATESPWQNLNPSFESGLSGSVTNCSPLTISNGTVAAYPSCSITCNSGYTFSAGSCVANSGGGGGGGGGGSSYSPPCSSVTFGTWQTACFSGLNYRNVLSQSPSGCVLTTAQQNDQQRACPTGTVPGETIPPVVPPVTPTTGGTVLENIASEAVIMGSNNTDTLLTHLGGTANLAGEQASLIKYKTILGLDSKISAGEKSTINDFIFYGTNSTQRLGAGERAAVINSYFQAYGKLPNSEAEWSDVLKIASGRWPTERSAKAEAQAKAEFLKVYRRNANMSNNIDENAIMVIAYGLLPLSRNLNSEKVAINTFRYVYGHAPVSALAWNVVRAIAYSGAKR